MKRKIHNRDHSQGRDARRCPGYWVIPGAPNPSKGEKNKKGGQKRQEAQKPGQAGIYQDLDIVVMGTS